MSLGPTRYAKLTVWTLAGLTWSWAAVASSAQPPGVDDDVAPPPEPAASTVTPGDGAAMPASEPGRVLVLRLSPPREPEVIVRRVYVEVPAGTSLPRRGGSGAASAPSGSGGQAPGAVVPAPQPVPQAPAPAPPPQRSSGS